MADTSSVSSLYSSGTSASSSDSLSSSSTSTSDITSKFLSGSITINGLGSGTDMSAVVDQLVAIESINKTRLETWKTTWENKITCMQGLSTRLQALQEVAAGMDTSSEFLARTASSSDTTVVSATADNTAKNGAYQVVVATDSDQVLRSAGVADQGTTVVSQAGTMKLVSNGVTYSVTLDGTETLSSLASKINAVTGSNIVASVENDGTTSNPYHLLLTSGTGGSDGRITVSANPTDFSFDTSNMAVKSSTLGVTASLAGQYTGDSANGDVAHYNFTVQNVSGSGTVGTDSFELSYTKTWDDGTTSSPVTISVPADYVAGDNIEVEDGMYIQLGAGTVTDGQTLAVNGYANNIDAPELTKWSGTSAVSMAGNYTGSVNKSYTFTVMNNGAVSSGGTSATTLRWTDSTGRTGTVSVSDSDTTYTVDNGVSIKLGAGTLTDGDTFRLDVYAPTQTQGQDKGLAQAAKVVHSGFSDQNDTAVTTADGTFSYTYAGQTISVAVSANTTLQGLMNAINNDTNNPGVTASIINDGMGLPTSYKLVLTGDDTGAANQITSVSDTFTGSDFGDGGTLGGGFSTSQLATNSMVKVDGYPSGTNNYLQRSTNKVSDVITGVVLNLADAGDSVVTVTTDTSTIESNIQNLVDAVNTVQAYIRENTKFDDSSSDTSSDSSENSTGILIGNYAFYILKSQVDSSLNDTIAGLKDGTDTFTNLAQIGIHTDPDNDGTWTIDTDVLEAALSADPDAVAKLFVSDTTTGVTGVASRVNTLMTQQTDSSTGIVSVLISNYNDIIDDIDTRIDQETDRLQLYKQNLTERFARLESTLATLNAESSTVKSAVASLSSSTSSS